MRSFRILILATAAAGALLWARPAVADVELGLGADWLASPGNGAFQVTLAGDQRLSRHLSWGGRIGLLVLTDPSRFGVPIDALLRGHFGRIYVEGMVGPWIVFNDHEALRFHGAIGFGLETRSVRIGLEVGYLDPTSVVGLRLAFPI
jgi:hypothetical protein